MKKQSTAVVDIPVALEDGRVITVRQIQLPDPTSGYRVFEAVIRGIPPGLLMHNPAGMTPSASTTSRRVRKAPAPEEEAAKAAYRDEEGRLCLKADHVKQAMLDAAAGFKPATVADDLKRALLSYVPTFPLMRGGQYLYDWDEIDLRRVVVKKRGIVRARPLIRAPWEAVISFLYDATRINDESVLATILVHAGRSIGLLDYRPYVRDGRGGGEFGRFVVVEARTLDVTLNW